MYELKNGSARLVGALERCMDDPERMAHLTSILYYCADQLPQDIQALVDYYEKAREKDRKRSRGMER